MFTNLFSPGSEDEEAVLRATAGEDAANTAAAAASSAANGGPDDGLTTVSSMEVEGTPSRPLSSRRGKLATFQARLRVWWQSPVSKLITVWMFCVVVSGAILYNSSKSSNNPWRRSNSDSTWPGRTSKSPPRVRAELTTP